jgi:hypothetical protein
MRVYGVTTTRYNCSVGPSDNGRPERCPHACSASSQRERSNTDKWGKNEKKKETIKRRYINMKNAMELGGQSSK